MKQNATHFINKAKVVALIPVIHAFFICNLSLTDSAFAHEDHTHKEELGTTAEMKMNTAESYTSKYEALLKFFPATSGEPLEMLLYICDYKSNEPLQSAHLQLVNTDIPSQAFAIVQDKPGIWKVQTTMPEERAFNLELDITGKDETEKIKFNAVDFTHHHEAGAKLMHEHTHAWIYVIGAGLLLLGLLLGAWLSRIKLSGRATTAVLVFCLLPLTQWKTACAHEGHEYETVKKRNASGYAEFDVTKESQFLLEIRTMMAGEGAFDNGRRMYGTVIPSSDGKAEVSSPQAGKILSLHVKPGETVSKGQLLASIERTMDAASDINYLVEKNRIESEYEAAKKEYERLKSISDIASKKSLEEAEARYRANQQNHELFHSNNRTVTLKSPINGVLAPFVLSVGSYINAEQILFTINNLQKVYIEAQAYESDVSAITQAQSFEVQCTEENHTMRDVRVVSMGQEFNTSNQSQKVLFEMNNSDGHFKLGEFVNVWAYKARSNNVMAVPNEAITEIEGRPVIFIKRAAEKYELRYVAVGENNGRFTEIKSGLNQSERYVSEGAYQVKLIYLNQ